MIIILIFILTAILASVFALKSEKKNTEKLKNQREFIRNRIDPVMPKD